MNILMVIMRIRNTNRHVCSAIYNLIHELRIPPRGIYEIGITINDRILYVSRPCFNDIPILKNVSLMTPDGKVVFQ
jgi:hypothetical protein